MKKLLIKPTIKPSITSTMQAFDKLFSYNIDKNILKFYRQYFCLEDAEYKYENVFDFDCSTINEQDFNLKLYYSLSDYVLVNKLSKDKYIDKNFNIYSAKYENENLVNKDGTSIILYKNTEVIEDLISNMNDEVLKLNYRIENIQKNINKLL
jgi:hypothetical protein